MKIESGHTLIELLIAVLISSIAATSLMKESLLIIKTTKKLELENKLTEIKNHLAAIINPINNGNWKALPKARVLDATTFLKTFPHLQSSKFKPSSSAISIINFNTDFYFAPIKNAVKLYCLTRLTNNSIPSPSGLNYLILNKEHWQEATLKLKKKKHSNCPSAYELVDSNNYNSSFNQPTAELEDSLLLPLNDSFSVYLAADNSIRRLDHSSLNNQPIEYKIDTLEFEQTEQIIKTKITNKKSYREFSTKVSPPTSTLELYAVLIDQQK